MISFEEKYRFLTRQDGVTIVEYALLAALLAVVSITSVSFLGSEVNDTFETSGKAVGGVGDFNPPPGPPPFGS
jgi:pilus assembly protein Flp/PilA